MRLFNFIAVLVMAFALVTPLTASALGVDRFSVSVQGDAADGSFYGGPFYGCLEPHVTLRGVSGDFDVDLVGATLPDANTDAVTLGERFGTADEEDINITKTFSSPTRGWYLVAVGGSDTQPSGAKAEVMCDGTRVNHGFYGMDTSFGSNNSTSVFDFNYASDELYTPLVLPSTDTGAFGTGPWRTVLQGTPTGGGLGQIALYNTQGGDVVLRSQGDIVADVANNVSFRGVNSYQNSTNTRTFAMEFRLGIDDVSDSDVFMGLCHSTQTELLNPDGTLVGSQHVGFHFLATDGNDFPILTTSGGTGSYITPVTIPDFNDSAPDSVMGFRRYGVKLSGRHEVEWYIDDQLVGTHYITGSGMHFENHICYGTTSNGDVLDDVWLDVVKWASDRL